MRRNFGVRRNVGVSLGPTVVGAALPHPDLNDTASILAGLIKRAASKHPKPDPERMARFRVFVKKFIEKNFVPLAADSDVSVQRWLDNTSYPLWRKEELLRASEGIVDRNDPKHKIVKCFVKDECYPEPKHVRNIFSRTDAYKTMVGPIFKLIEEEVYKHPSFIKHVPVADRPRYIQEMLSRLGARYRATDYTAFESQFTRELMTNCEFQLYEFMTQFLPDHEQFMKDIEAIRSPNVCHFRNVSCKLPVCRMSGEMNTSLGNGFSNLMFLLFTAEEEGCTGVVAVVEGDDGLATWEGPSLDSTHFAKLGLTIKLEEHHSLSTASFCGLIFDEEELINVRDPREVLVDFGWGDRKYARSRASKLKRLLRAKSLSLAHQYPGCPIVSSLAHYGLRVTRGHNIGNIFQHYSMWYRDILDKAIKDEKNIVRKTPGPRTRALVEEKFNISVWEQMAIEKYFDSKNELSEIESPEVLFLMSDHWNHYSENFTRYQGTENFDYFIENEGRPEREILVGLVCDYLDDLRILKNL